MAAVSDAGSGNTPETGAIRRALAVVAGALDDLGVAEKIYGIIGLLVVVAMFLVAMSVQSVRLQAAYRDHLASSSSAAINIGRVNGLIYAIVMESRGIYMSTDPAKVRGFGGELLKRNRELADIVADWENTVRPDDEALFLAFKDRIKQFIVFREELVRRANQVSPAAGREWGDNDANRALRTALNVDLEALANIYAERAQDVMELGNEWQYATWYLLALGVAMLALAALGIFVVRRYLVGPLSDIARATDQITAGKLEQEIPFVTRPNEIGHLARAVRNFQQATCRNLELEQLEIGTARQRDKAMGERNRLNDKYLETRWQLHAALNNMAQGVVMIDSRARVQMTNQRFRIMYQLPREMFGPDCSLRDILEHRKKMGYFEGSVDAFVNEVLDRIAKGKPSVTERVLADGRIIRISDQPMAGGGWVATHEDFTEQRRAARLLERTERFLATVVENVTQAITAKDARDLRYIFVNKAAEKLLGLPRAQILGKSPRELFPAETADLIERQDRQLLAGGGDLEVAVRTVGMPDGGRRTVSARRLRIAGDGEDSQVLLSLIDNRTDQAAAAEAAA
jgi:PAS domain S-box-containing protein